MDEDHEEKKLSDAEVPIYPFAMKLLNFKNPSRNGGNLNFLTWTNKLSPCLCTQNNNNDNIIIIIIIIIIIMIRIFFYCLRMEEIGSGFKAR